MVNKVAGIQMTSGHEVGENLAVAKGLIQQAVDCGASLIVLPENFAIMGLNQMDKLKHRESFGCGQIQDFLATQAAQHDIWLVGGTIPIAVPSDNNKVRAACLVFDNQGQCAGRYDKIHLFDVTLPAHQEIHRESETIEPGHEVVVIQTPVGRLGLAVCYDVRFPELFRAMHAEKVEIVALPAAFTYVTGSVHWDILIRARAIENQIYMIAAAQTGLHSNTRKTYGNSMVVNGWGEVQAQLGEKVGVVVSEINLESLEKIRQNFPALLHRKL